MRGEGNPGWEKGEQEREGDRREKSEGERRERRGAQHLVCESSPQSRERAPAGAIGGGGAGVKIPGRVGVGRRWGMLVRQC